MVLPDEARTTVISYLAHQGGKDVPAIVQPVERERRRLADLLADISEEQAAFIPSSGGWSIKEVVRHVAGAERGVAVIIARLAGVPEPSQESRPVGPSLADACRELGEARARLLELVAGVPPHANLEARHEHPFFGPLNWKEWLAFQRVHDGDHIAQIEAIQGLPTYPKA